MEKNDGFVLNGQSLKAKIKRLAASDAGHTEKKAVWGDGPLLYHLSPSRLASRGQPGLFTPEKNSADGVANTLANQKSKTTNPISWARPDPAT